MASNHASTSSLGLQAATHPLQQHDSRGRHQYHQTEAHAGQFLQNGNEAALTPASVADMTKHRSSLARARTRSTGTDLATLAKTRARGISFTNNGGAGPSNHAAEAALAAGEPSYDLHSPERGPGTPDFTLGRYAQIKGERGEPHPSSSIAADRASSSLRNTVFGATGNGGDDDVSNDMDDEDEKKKLAYSSQDGKRVFPPRPRLTTQLRSFVSSFIGESKDEAGAGGYEAAVAAGSKRRPSADNDTIGGYLSADKFQGLTASAQSLQASQVDSRDARSSHFSAASSSGLPQRPKPLAMPSARQGGINGLNGLNDDSPPLTPAGSDEQGSDKEVLSSGVHVSNNHEVPNSGSYGIGISSVWSPLSSTLTPSSASSGRSSPIYGQGIGGVGQTSSSAYPLQQLVSEGLLPSHVLSPPSSPDPHDPSRHQRRKLVQSSQQALASSWLQVLPELVSSLGSRAHSFFFATQMPPLQPHVPALLFLMTAFVGSTLCILLALSTLPLKLPSHITELTMAEIRDMSLSLREYSRSSNKAFAHTLAVLGAFFTWKQAFTVPGSIIMNVVFGAMYGTFRGTLFTSVLTAVGGMFCYLLMEPLGPLISAMPGLNKVLQKMRKGLRGSIGPQSPAVAMTTARRGGLRHGSRLRSVSNARSAGLPTPLRQASKTLKAEAQRKTSKSSGNLWSYLLVLRVLPIVPYGLMNIACSVLRVPLLPYTVTLGLGSIPWNACTVQIGDLLVEVVSALPAAASDIAGQLDTGGFSDAPSPAGADLDSIGASRLHMHIAGEAATALKGQAQTGLQAISAKIWNRDMMLKLALMSIVSLAPMLIQRYLKRNGGDEAPEEGEEEEDAEEGEAAALLRDEMEQAHVGPASLEENRASILSSERVGGTRSSLREARGHGGHASSDMISSPDMSGRTLHHERTPSVKRAIAHTMV